MMEYITKHKTKILPLRWFANTCERIAHKHLLEALYLDERNKRGFAFKYRMIVCRLFYKPYMKWGTMYKVKFDDN